MKCRNCKEEFSNNQSDIDEVCFSCLVKIVDNYFELREEEEESDKKSCSSCGQTQAFTEGCDECKKTLTLCDIDAELEAEKLCNI